MSNRSVASSCRLSFILSVVVLVAAGCSHKPAPPPPPEVEVITLSPTNVPLTEEWIGTLDGFVNAQIHAQVTGYLLSQDYTEGSEVKKGDLLFQIDPRPFQATLDQAKAKLAQDKAQEGITELDVKRYTPLAKEQAISQQELDNTVQGNLAAKAQVQADQAAVDNAQLNLDFTRVTSPVDGLAGIAQGQIGDLVGQSGPLLTTVSTINPIKVYFQVSEQSYLTYWSHLVNQSANQDPDPPLQLVLSDGSLYPEKGRVFFADRQVDPNTGTLQIVGLFSNANYLLRPGQYGRVRAQTQMQTNVLLVPQRAVIELQGSYQLALVDETNAIHLQSIQVGPQIGGNWLVESGVKSGDRVVIEGTEKAKDGLVVDPQPYTPAAQTNSSSQHAGN